MLIGLFGNGCGLNCVIKNGACVVRPTLRFTGRPYDIKHYDSHPEAGPLSSKFEMDGGRIAGVVCGASVEYLVRHDKDRVAVDGFVDNQTAYISISDFMGTRLIKGSLGSRTVELQLFGDRLAGFVGRFSLDMRLEPSDGNTLVQLVVPMVGGKDYMMKLRFRDVDSLWAMSPAAQAAIVPIMALCLYMGAFANMGRDPEPLRFGGPASGVPIDLLRFR